MFSSRTDSFEILMPLASSLNLPPGAVKKAEAATRELAYEYLMRVADRVQGRNFAVKTATLTGQPHAGIIRFAEENCCDIIVMCTRGHSGVSRWLMGSVADRVVRGANIPVFSIRAQKDVQAGE